MVAHHEAGHVVVAWLLPGATKPAHVTIIPDEVSNGAMTPKSTTRLVDVEAMIDDLAVCFAGTVAQQEFGFKHDVGASGDLQKATYCARSMVCDFGFSEKLPRRAYDLESGLLTEELLTTINSEIDRFLKLGEDRAIKTVKTHLSTIKRVARILLEKGELDEDGIRKAIETAKAA
jgi:cell division protease FtsH